MGTKKGQRRKTARRAYIGTKQDKAAERRRKRKEFFMANKGLKDYRDDAAKVFKRLIRV